MTGQKLPARLRELMAYYGKTPSRAELAVEREVYGINAGITSNTTPAQADLLAEALRLGPRAPLLEVGAGSGWPGIYLAKRTGCEVALTDVPAEGIRSALGRAVREGVDEQYSFAVASGARLPFRARYLDAVVHTDVLG